MRTLPKKPSKLLRIALEDMRKARKNKSITLDMNEWLSAGLVGPRDTAKSRVECSMCMAGCVMAYTLKKLEVVTKAAEDERQWDDERMIEPDDMGRNENRLIAIDWFREGSISNALERLGYDVDGDLINQKIDVLHRLYWGGDCDAMSNPKNDFRASTRAWTKFIEKLEELKL